MNGASAIAASIRKQQQERPQCDGSHFCLSSNFSYSRNRASATWFRYRRTHIYPFMAYTHCIANIPCLFSHEEVARASTL